VARIQLPEGLPGIRWTMVFIPETTKPLCDLVQALLTARHALTPAERDMIATQVSFAERQYLPPELPWFTVRVKVYSDATGDGNFGKLVWLRDSSVHES
jgi:hypothetical protein